METPFKEDCSISTILPILGLVDAALPKKPFTANRRESDNIKMAEIDNAHRNSSNSSSNRAQIPFLELTRAHSRSSARPSFLGEDFLSRSLQSKISFLQNLLLSVELDSGWESARDSFTSNHNSKALDCSMIAATFQAQCREESSNLVLDDSSEHSTMGGTYDDFLLEQLLNFLRTFFFGFDSTSTSATLKPPYVSSLDRFRCCSEPR
jgi:hypothetical protein